MRYSPRRPPPPGFRPIRLARSCDHGKLEAELGQIDRLAAYLGLELRSVRWQIVHQIAWVTALLLIVLALGWCDSRSASGNNEAATGSVVAPR